VSGDDSLGADRIVVGVEVNGRPADAVAFTMQPSITDGTSQGRLSWAFGTRRPGDAGCASCASDLGLTRGQNRIEVTIADARSGAVVGAAEALVVGRTDLRSAFVPTARRAHGRTRRR
jgi:hypothetical protein